MNKSKLLSIVDVTLLSRRIINIVGRIDCQSVSKLAECIQWLKNQESKEYVYIYIQSKGGEVLPAIEIYEMLMKLRDSGIRTVTVVKEALSMACLVALAGSIRLVLVDGIILVHQLESGQVAMSSTEVANGLFALQWKVDGMYLSHLVFFQRYPEEFKILRNEGKNMTADEAVALGFFDKKIESFASVMHQASP